MELFYCGNQWGYTPLGRTVNIPQDHCSDPLDPKVTVLNQYARFEWTAPHDYEYFQLEYKLMGDSIYTTVIVHGTNYTVALNHSTGYYWRVRTICDSSTDRGSDFVSGPEFTTGTFLPGCNPVTIVTVTNMGNFYRIGWLNTGGLYYKVYICPNASNCNQYVLVQGNTTSPDFYYDAMNLQMGVQYQTKVIAVCANGLDSMPSPWVPFIVTNSLCLAPTNFNAISQVTSIFVTWMQAVINATYNIYLDNNLVAANYPGTSFTFQQLTPDTTYAIAIRANCVTGFSTPLTGTATTQRPPCQCIFSFNVQNITGTSVTFEFYYTSCPQGVAESYLFQLNNNAPEIIPLTDTTKTIDGLIAGIPYTATLKMKCTSGEYGPPVTAQFTIVGCGAIDEAAMTAMVVPGNQIEVRWMAVPNAVMYVVQTIIDGVDAGSTSTPDTTLSVPLIYDKAYQFIVKPQCKINGNMVDGSAGVISITPGLPACILYTIVSAKRDSATTVAVEVDMSNLEPGATGRARLYILDTMGGQVTSSMIIYSSGTYILGGVAEGGSYLIYVYDIPAGVIPPDPLNDRCQLGAGFPYDHKTCWILQPANIGLSFDSETALRVSFIGAAFTPLQEFVLVIWFLSGGTPVDLGQIAIADFPLVIDVPGYGRYGVWITPICEDTPMAQVEQKYSCPDLISVAVQVSGTSVSIAVTPEMVGNFVYYVKLTALGYPTISTSATSNLFTITGLKPGIIYAGEIKMQCNQNPETFSNTIAFNFMSGTGTGNASCSEPSFHSSVTDCITTGGGGPGGGGGSGRPECKVEVRDWTVGDYNFMNDSSDPANKIFFESVFSISQSGAQYQDMVIPGGILGVITGTDCLPNSTVSGVLEILQGALYTIVAGSTIAINGNITAHGSYTSSGGSQLIVRVRATYTKALTS